MDRPIVEEAFDRLYLGTSALSRAYRDGRDSRKKLQADLQLDMKEAEIAALLGVAETTVSAQLHRARRKLIVQLGADHPFTRGDGEGASP